MQQKSCLHRLLRLSGMYIFILYLSFYHSIPSTNGDIIALRSQAPQLKSLVDKMFLHYIYV